MKIKKIIYYINMKRRSQGIRLLLAFALMLILSGCATKVGMFLHGNIAPLTTYQIKFSDGYSGYYYVHTKGDRDNSDAIVFFISGSGHTSHNYYLRNYFSELKGNVTIYALQKRYVKHRETGMGRASREFDFHNHNSQLVQDQKEFIEHIIKNNDFKNKKVILFGVSEGGNISVQIINEIKEITHLVILGSGGMPTLEEFKIWGKQYNLDFDLIYKHVQKDPDNINSRVAGQTFKYWASMLPFKPMDHFRSITIPIFVAIGEQDEMVPVESVHFLKNEFVALNKDNLIVKIFPNCNHRLVDSKGKNRRLEFFNLVSDWWNK